MGFWWWGGSALGVIILVRIIMKFLSDTSIDLNNLGPWAVVTGATDGIGRAFTHELAKKGFNIVLISRTPQKLSDAAKVIEEKFSVSTKVIQADFSSTDEVMYAILRDELRLLEVGVLINNVGTGCLHPEYFLDLEKCHDEVYKDILYCNIWATVNMTRYVLPGMIARGKGLIINVSSLLAEFPAPFDSMYGASKAFVTKFSKDLDLEYREKGVHIHVLNSGLVGTQINILIKELTGSWVPLVTPETYARSALGDATRNRVCTGHVSHTFLQTVARLMNPWLLESIMFYIMKNKRIAISEMCVLCQEKRSQ